MNFDIRFCKCGRIHVIPHEIIDEVAEDYNNKSLLLVCSHCGVVKRIYFDEYENGLAYNSVEVTDATYKPEDKNTVMVSNGIKVYTRSQYCADTYFDGMFISSEEFKDRGFWKIYNNYGEAYRDGNAFVTVNGKDIKNEIRRHYHEKADEILKAIHGYVTKIDWSDIPEFNKEEA